MGRILALVLVLSLGGTTLRAGEMAAYFAPDGGFSPKNQGRTLTMPDGKVVKATLSNALIQMIERTESGGTIKICMYAMGDMNTIDVLIHAARNRGITVKLLLDACAAWTNELRDNAVKRVVAARKEAKAKKQPFDFQIQFITKQSMEDRGRTRTLDDGKVIFGTMHEKFGVFYSPRSRIPYESFAGSSNVSKGSDQIFAENRIFFWDDPGVARQFQEEFARLWNEYGTPVEGHCKAEQFVPAYPVPGSVRVVFNGEPITEDKYHRIDEELEKLIRQVWWKGGSIDVAMFSFTHRELADALMKYATLRPESKFRILLDQSMLAETEDRLGVMGPWFERQIRLRNLKNVEVRYKWRSTAFGWDEEVKKVQLVHVRSLLLHHKLLVVNKNVMATGSYNWSASAESRNLENVMIFERAYRGQGEIIDGFLAEYDTIWDSLKPEGPVQEPVIGRPQTVTGPQGRELREKIITLLGDEANLKMVEACYWNKWRTAEALGRIVKLKGEDLQLRLDVLVAATLLCKMEKNGKVLYTCAD